MKKTSLKIYDVVRVERDICTGGKYQIIAFYKNNRIGLTSVPADGGLWIVDAREIRK